MTHTHAFLARCGRAVNRAVAVSLLAVLAGGSLAATGEGDASEFLGKAATGSIAEVALARMAQTKTDNQQVQEFAQMMIEDHNKALEEARDLAARRNIELDANLTPEQEQLSRELSQRSGSEFNQAYMDAMVKEHEKTVQAFEQQAEQGSSEVAAYAQKQLPVLRQHLEQAQSIASNL